MLYNHLHIFDKVVWSIDYPRLLIPRSQKVAVEMITVMILIRHAKDQNIHLLHQDRAIIIIASMSIIFVHHHRVHTRNHVEEAQRAVAVILAVIRGIQIDRVNIRDMNGHRVDQAKAVANAISIHMKEAIREVTATNIVDIEFIDLWPCQIEKTF